MERKRNFFHVGDEEGDAMVDGTRRRRESDNATKSRWYAVYRAERFRRRFGWPLTLGETDIRAMCAREEQRCDPHPPPPDVALLEFVL
jgi:hypothetical protein